MLPGPASLAAHLSSFLIGLEDLAADAEREGLGTAELDRALTDAVAYRLRLEAAIRRLGRVERTPDVGAQLRLAQRLVVDVLAVTGRLRALREQAPPQVSPRSLA